MGVVTNIMVERSKNYLFRQGSSIHKGSGNVVRGLQIVAIVGVWSAL